MKINNDTHICFSIISTGKCNCNCSYCHFYADKDRAAYNRDIDPKLFDRYVDYLKHLTTITPHIACRLSGGEPLFMGDAVFELTDKIYEETGISPYIMTNGKMLSPELIEKAAKHHISSFVVYTSFPTESTFSSNSSRRTKSSSLSATAFSVGSFSPASLAVPT